MWYHYSWVHTCQINMGGKFKYFFKTTAQLTIHFIISLYVLLGNNLQHYKAFTCSRKRPSTVNKHCRSGQCSCSKPRQESKFSCPVFVCVEKQRFGDPNFLGENDSDWSIFAVQSRGWKFKADVSPTVVYSHMDLKVPMHRNV